MLQTTNRALASISPKINAIPGSAAFPQNDSGHHWGHHLPKMLNFHFWEFSRCEGALITFLLKPCGNVTKRKAEGCFGWGRGDLPWCSWQTACWALNLWTQTDPPEARRYRCLSASKRNHLVEERWRSNDGLLDNGMRNEQIPKIVKILTNTEQWGEF